MSSISWAQGIRLLVFWSALGYLAHIVVFKERQETDVTASLDAAKERDVPIA